MNILSLRCQNDNKEYFEGVKVKITDGPSLIQYFYISLSFLCPGKCFPEGAII